MKSMFVISEIKPGRLNALVKNIMRQIGTTDPTEAVRCINSEEWMVVQKAPYLGINGGVVHFSVVSDGTTGSQWIKRLEDMGGCDTDNVFVRNALLSEDFKPTCGIVTEIAILKKSLFKEENLSLVVIQIESANRKLIELNPEVACLIIEFYSKEDFDEKGISEIIIMSKPIRCALDCEYLFVVSKDSKKERLSLSVCHSPIRFENFIYDYSFAFGVSSTNVRIKN